MDEALEAHKVQPPGVLAGLMATLLESATSRAEQASLEGGTAPAAGALFEPDVLEVCLAAAAL